MCVHKCAYSLNSAVFVLFLTACDFFSVCDSEVLLNVASPTGEYDLILVKENCGATTAYVHKVFLVNSGMVFRPEDKVFVADEVQGIDVSWISKFEAVIIYESARIFSYRNFRSFPDREIYVREMRK